MRRSATFAAILAAAAVLAAASPAAAMYHPTLGRWCQRDRQHYADGLNPYEYALAMPVGARDAKGESVSREEDPQCLEDLAEQINDLICQAVTFSRVAKRGGYNRGDEGRLASLGRPPEIREKWTFKVHIAGLLAWAIASVQDLLRLERGSAAVVYGLPFGRLDPEYYVRKPPDLCRGIGELIKTNLEEAFHQNQQKWPTETLEPKRSWKGVEYNTVGYYTLAIKGDMAAVLHLSPEEDNGFRRPQRECCCPRLLKMARDIAARELRWEHRSIAGKEW
ncbi:MAG: hypothetical protein FJ288_18740 [Planctomycetes bacterium]|nr:hypothetical protein [Planctomycetota bacterium]